MYCMWLLFLRLPCKTGTVCQNKDSQRYREAENERKGGEEIMNQTRVINGPHIRTDNSTRKVMMNVSISLIPALLGAIYYFGIRAFYLAGLSVSVCVVKMCIRDRIM